MQAKKNNLPHKLVPESTEVERGGRREGKANDEGT